MEKSANKRWKESGSTLSFKEWIDRENKKKNAENKVNFIPNFPDTNSIARDTIDSTLRESRETIEQTVGFRKDANIDKDKVFGLDKRILIFSGVLIAGSIGFYFYKKMKK